MTQTAGFEEYVNTFEENDVDVKVLMNLTEQDLIDMGISSEGTRLSLLEQVSSIFICIMSLGTGSCVYLHIFLHQFWLSNFAQIRRV